MNMNTDDSVDGSGGFGAVLGGSVGDGLMNSSSVVTTAVPPGAPVSTPYYSAAGAVAPNTTMIMPSTPTAAQSLDTAGLGSITRFAPVVQQQQQQQQQQSPAGYNPNYYAPQQQQQQVPPNTFLGGGGSYAARSQQLYGNQSPPPTTTQPVVSSRMSHNNNSTAGWAPSSQSQSYAVPSPQTYNSSNNNNYGGSTTTTLQQLPQQPPAGNVYTPPRAGLPQQQPMSASSYASRSAAILYGPQSPPPVQQQPQQQPYNQSQPQPSQAQQSVIVDAATVGGHSYPSYGVPQQTQPQQPKFGAVPTVGIESAQQQHRLLTDATRKVQEHAYYMKQAMEQQSLPVVLDRAAHMVGELGGPPHGQPHNVAAPVNTGGSAKLNPKNYYELYLRALEDLPLLEEYLIKIAVKNSDNHDNTQINALAPQPDMIRIVSGTTPPPPSSTISYTMRQLYDCVQYCPRVVSRLYLQIAAGSALIRSGECGAAWVLRDLQQAVKCEQNPVRGLFVRYYLLTALRDKLPDRPLVVESTTTSGNAADTDGKNDGDDDDDDSVAHYDDQIKSKDAIDEHDPGTVKDSYEFVLSNFMEMNKLWVRIQHLPGEGKNKDVRKRRERERNDLRILVGTNLVRLSQLECVTSQIYGQVILSQILDHIVTTGDPLSQAYLMDCLVQVFPDEYHIETMPILLNVCPRLRDKVNIRTILQGLMDRLANYLAEEELLDEHDTNLVKQTLARDSFRMFDDCVQKVYNARGPKLNSKEVIRLQTALVQFSIRCYPGNVEQVSRCVQMCVEGLQQANTTSYGAELQQQQPMIQPLDEASVMELEKFLSIPLDTLAMKVLEVEHYSALIGFLPWVNRRQVALTLLRSMENITTPPATVADLEQLFRVMEPLLRSNNAPSQQYYPVDPSKIQEENWHVSKLVHLLLSNSSHHNDASTTLAMLQVARQHIGASDPPHRMGATLPAVVFAALKLARQVFLESQGLATTTTTEKEESKSDNDDAAAAAANTNKASALASEDTTVEPKTDNIAAPSDSPETAAEAGTLEEEAGAGLSAVNSEEGVDTKRALLDSLTGSGKKETEETLSVQPVTPKKLSCRTVFVFVQEVIVTVAKYSPGKGLMLYLDAALAADTFAKLAKDGTAETDYVPIALELLTQAFSLYEEQITEEKAQCQSVQAMCGTLMALQSISKESYESLITKTAQFSAKILNKPDQCKLVALCAHLFYPVGSGGGSKYNNPQRALECLQRCLKLADACTSMNPAHMDLFVDLLEDYVHFFENRNTLITHAYITGLIALIKEHINNNTKSFTGDAEATKAHFMAVLRYIQQKKEEPESAELFALVQTGD